MDTGKIGKFLAQLRRERGLTQEALGEKLGVSNKTVSRWETGSYIPPVDMLLALSELYGVSINELLSGRTLGEAEFRSAAEENLTATLRESSFTDRERMDYFKSKWLREHRASLLTETLAILAAMVVGFYLNNGLQLVAFLLVVLNNVVRYNRMMAYVESRVFGEADK